MSRVQKVCQCVRLQQYLLIIELIRDARSRGANTFYELSRNGAFPMPVAIRPAIPDALPRTAATRAGRERLLCGLATAVTVLTAAIAILVVATAAVVLGIT